MANAKLISVSIERFKSHATLTRLDLGLLNVIIGKNNSGKSSVIQALLLLKQTLEFPRLDVPLRLEGYVDALSIRELTYGWPDASTSGDIVIGPSFILEWESNINVARALSDLGNPDLATLSSKANLSWINSNASITSINAINTLTLNYVEQQGKTVLQNIQLDSTVIQDSLSFLTSFYFERSSEGNWLCYFDKEISPQLVVSLEHFLPYVSINRRNVGPRDRQRSWFNAFHILFVESLEDLRGLIKGFAFLSSTRTLPKNLYNPSTEPTDNIGVSGENAALLLQSHQSDYVHYLLPRITEPGALPEFREQTLVEAVNEVLIAIGVDSSVSIEEIRNAGFRLLFGRASLQHVGRGLTFLLPLIQLGLVSDPMRYKHKPNLSLSEYDELTHVVCAFEEPEAHLHPKVQSGLALWFIALAMGRRQVIVETHSDHLVRKLRSLVATAPANSPMENWLLKNVRLISVEQNNGVSSLIGSGLTKEGGLEIWPEEFMDESVKIEQEIYFASMDKLHETGEGLNDSSSFVHHESGAPVEGNS